MRLSEEFAKTPNRSQVDVFMDFTATMMQLQKQLDTPYHEDMFLRDHLLTAVDVPGIQTSLRDPITRTSEQSINRVANCLSEKRRTAGSSVYNVDDGGQPKPEELYSLGQSYNGD